MAKEFTYEITKKIGSLGQNSDKQLNVISWNGREAKIDLRQVYEKDGEVRFGKGISLTNDEAKKLVDLLTDYLNDEDDDF